MICPACATAIDESLICGPVKCACGVTHTFPSTAYLLHPVELQGNLWQELHTYKFADEFSARMWFAKWMARIPKYGSCNCSDHFATLLAELPADFSSSEAFFVRGWEWHNRVNARLGKPEISLDEARRLWKDS